MAAVKVASVPAVQRDQVDLLGTHVDRLKWEALGGWLEQCIESRKPHQVVTVNLDFIAIARKRPLFHRVVSEADLVVCDGKPLQWAARLQGKPIPRRITGMDLVLHTAKLSAEGKAYRIFLLGAEPWVAERAARQIQEYMPGAVIAGHYSPPAEEFSPEGSARIIEIVRAAHADALFVALGAPRQDEWIHQHLQELGVPLCAGIGGVLDFLAGKRKRAPRWIQQLGMEWAFRLAQEPGRLWRRYLVNDLPIFAQLLTHQAMRRMRNGARAPASKLRAPVTVDRNA